MKRHVKTLIKHPLVTGSGVLFAGTFIVNLLNYIFNLIMGRLLTIEQYGLLVSLTSFISIITIFQASLIQLFAKFSAKYTAQKNTVLKKNLFKSGFKISLLSTLILFSALMIVIIPFSKFLHVNSLLILVLTFMSASFIILTSLPLGILQGELRFIPVSVINVSMAIFKILIGVGLVILGLGATGGMMAFTLSLFISYLISFYFHKSYRNIKDTSTQPHFFNEFKKVSIPFLIASFGVIVLQSTDIILVRHFLSPKDAGLFAALSLMGKAIFYITSPLFFVFFPLIAQKAEKKEDTKNTLFLALGIVLSCNLFFTLLYFLFPSFVISIFFPQSGYQVLVPYLGFYATYIMIFSLAFLLYNFYLSLGKTQIYKLSLSSAAFYFLLIFYIHKSISDFINILILSSFLLFISLLVYYLKLFKK